MTTTRRAAPCNYNVITCRFREGAGRLARGGLAGLACLAISACASPEAERVRGGGPGADPGNRDAVVEIHGGAEPYAGTPCLTSLPECTGPLPVSGLTREDER